jgi:hypothetical protein
VAGYSGTPLVRKLGIKADSRLLLLRAPDGFALEDLPDGVRPHTRPAAAPYDTIVLFCAAKVALVSGFGPAAARLTVAGGLWVCWPKKSGGLQTDLTEGDVRSYGLDAGLVDVKVCAVDDTWSALRFVRRLADR